MSRQTFSTPDAPAPAAAYAQAAQVGPVVATAGQVGTDPHTGALAGPGVAEQTTRAMANVVAALRAAGRTLDDVVRMDCYLTDAADADAFNEAYAAWFPKSAPARTTVVVGLLGDFRVELTALAVAR